MMSLAQSRSTGARLATFAGALLALAAATLPASARAGAYHVYSCRLPNGESAPADAWSGSKTGTYTYVEDTCAQPGGALVAALLPALRTANTDIATWAFGAPTGETIASATLWRAGHAEGGGAINASYEFLLSGTRESEVFDACIYMLGCELKGTPGSPYPRKIESTFRRRISQRICMSTPHVAALTATNAQSAKPTPTATRPRSPFTPRTSRSNRARGRRRAG